jgi:hypothetical protein
MVSELQLGQVLMVRLYLLKRLMALAAKFVSHLLCLAGRCPHLGHHAHDEALLFNAVRLYCVRILKNLACSSVSAPVSASVALCEMPESERTGVDELLLGHLPALLCVDLGLELADLLRYVSQLL